MVDIKKKPRKKSVSPTQRSLAMLREEGYMVAVVEKWNPFVKIRQDLFGFIDLIAVDKDRTVGVQTTTADHAAERIAKIKSLSSALSWLESPHREIHVHGWAKRGARGEPKKWSCSITNILKEDIREKS